jgi:hypothetical protein
MAFITTQHSSASAHPLGGVVAAFAKLLNRNYRPAEDCYKFFDDAIDDTHSFIGRPFLLRRVMLPTDGGGGRRAEGGGRKAEGGRRKAEAEGRGATRLTNPCFW